LKGLLKSFGTGAKVIKHFKTYTFLNAIQPFIIMIYLNLSKKNGIKQVNLVLEYYFIKIRTMVKIAFLG
jgi:hypothetical protein